MKEGVLGGTDTERSRQPGSRAGGHRYRDRGQHPPKRRRVPCVRSGQSLDRTSPGMKDYPSRRPLRELDYHTGKMRKNGLKAP
ncbi:histidyl-tRNA synthetase [Streptomyces sp. NBRC 110611]|nr:histidyl-tRNA synthetase [Streptomyces sp. NBRC 110611]